MNYEDLLDRVKKGDGNATFILGYRYIYIEDLIEKGIEILERGKEEDPDNPRILFALADCYLKGKGKTKDEGKALDLYRKANLLLIAEKQKSYADSLREDNDPECMEWYEKSFKNGNKESPYSLAILYRDGLYVEKNYENYMDYLEKASQLGNLNANIDLANELIEKGEYKSSIQILTDTSTKNVNRHAVQIALRKLSAIYRNGTGVETDMLKAIEYATRLAELGLTKDLFDIAVQYYQGYSNELPDKKKALELFEIAGEYGDEVSMRNAGMMYYNGEGTVASLDNAIKWYLKAANSGSYSAIQRLENLMKEKYGESAKDTFIILLEELKEKGLNAAYLKYHDMYMEGDYVEKNGFMAKKCLEKALEGDYIPACLTIGDYLTNGNELCGIKKNIREAIVYWEKAATQGSLSPLRNLGIAYFVGKDIERNIKKAENYLLSAWNNGDKSVAEYLAELYYFEEYGKQDFAKAKEFLLIAADGGNTNALVEIGKIYENGLSGVKSNEMALGYYQKSIQANNFSGMFHYGRLLASLTFRSPMELEFGEKKYRDNSWDYFVEATSYLEKAMELGHPDAERVLFKNFRFHLYIQDEVGITQYLREKGESDVDDFIRKEFEFLTNHRENADPNDMYFIGQFYYYGKIVPKDIDKAISWFDPACEGGNLKAKYWMARLRYGQEDNPLFNSDMAIGLLEEVVEKGEEEYRNASYFYLGYLYCKYKDNMEKGIDWWLKSAETGESAAEYNLGITFHDGLGVNVDVAKAKYWLNRAKEHGHEEADEKIKEWFGDTTFNSNNNENVKHQEIGIWKCPRCGSENDIKKGMCPKCGTVKGYF